MIAQSFLKKQFSRKFRACRTSPQAHGPSLFLYIAPTLPSVQEVERRESDWFYHLACYGHNRRQAYQRLNRDQIASQANQPNPIRDTAFRPECVTAKVRLVALAEERLTNISLNPAATAARAVWRSLREPRGQAPSAHEGSNTPAHHH
jgi:hypothetical protein